MNKTIERKGRNPRITVCYTPDENQRIIEMRQEPKVMMSDKEAEALMSLKAARGKLILIKKALHGTTQEQRKKYFRNEQFMHQWIEGVNRFIRRLVEIESMFKR